MTTRERRVTDLGIEVQCARCREFWPEDAEFFFMKDGKAHSWCKACFANDPKVLAKVERWKARQRLHDPAPVAAGIDWHPLLQAHRSVVAGQVPPETSR